MRRLYALPLILVCLVASSLVAGVITTHTYSTAFPLTLSPISEASHWVNGKSTGVNWSDVSTTPGRAIGHEGRVLYSDSTALVQNYITWEPDQTVTATVFQVAGTTQPNCYQEVELRLRSHISAYSNTGYEVNFKVSKESYAYFQIVRWNGPIANFTYLLSKYGSSYGAQNGDVIKATMIGHTISVYKNAILLGQAVDSTFSSGAPGMGFNLSGANSTSSGGSCLYTNGNYGLSNFTAVSSRTWF